MQLSPLQKRFSWIFGIFLVASLLIGIGVKYLLILENPFEFVLMSIGIFILLMLLYDHLERALYQEQITSAIGQFRISHEVIIDHLSKVPSFSVSNAEQTPAKQDILAEIQILGNLIEKVLHPEIKEDLSLPESPSLESELEHHSYPQKLLSQVKQALQDDRIEMLLQPIVSLPQRKPRYFECYSRIRTKDNVILNPEDFLSIAEDNSLIQIIDNMMLFRCIQLIRKTLRKNFNIRFFVNLSSFTLNSDFFRDNFIDFIRENSSIAPNLIFEVDYPTLIEANPKTLHSLSELHAYGCHFSVDQLPSIDIDFQRLMNIKAKFVKIDASILQNLLEQDPSGSPLHQFKKQLDKAGCDLIITKVEDERIIVNLSEFNLDFGQGFLFGTPQLASIHS